MARKNIPFDFVFDYLSPLEVTVKPMFGWWAIYVDKKIVLILRERKDFTETNGVWIATSQEHHHSLKEQLPSLRSIPGFSKGLKETGWQLIPVDAVDFETTVMKVCELIKRYDHRIGKIPGEQRF